MIPGSTIQGRTDAPDDTILPKGVTSLSAPSLKPRSSFLSASRQ
jgi:hypothetical protein